MSGFQEILIVAIIVLAVIFLPRLRGQQQTGTRIQQSAPQITGRLRLAIAMSVIYPAIVAAVLQPWKGDMVRFIYIGLGPVLVAWLLYWVIKGFKNK